MPPREAHASAPGKIILLGEHAVVYGEPSLSLALDRRIRVDAGAGGPRATVNGEPLHAHRHAYIHQALERGWNGAPLQLHTESELPSASGVGSSAALSVATNAVLLRLHSDTPPAPPAIARAAFETELVTQGAASPNDTSVSTAGGVVLLSPSPRPGAELLWTIERDGRAWHVQRLPPLDLPLVVGNSGSRSHTADQVAKVRRFADRSAFARDLLRQIGQLTNDGVDALADGDLRRLGQLMNRNQDCLHTLGVDTPVLERLVLAARRVPGTYGAKLTGAGGGGSMIALSERPDDVVAALERLGAHAFRVRSSGRGVEVGP